jgi:hypothetical protein
MWTPMYEVVGVVDSVAAASIITLATIDFLEL